MTTTNNDKLNSEEEAMLKPKKDVKIFSKRKEKKDDANLIQDFLRSISSTATLPGYIKGNSFSSRRGVLNQCLVTSAVLLLAAGCGQPIGFSAVLLPQLYKENGTMRIDAEMGSWIASIHSASTPLGAFVSGAVMDYVGRRSALQLSLLPLMIGWVIVAVSNSFTVMMLGRIVCGFAVGVTAATNSVYLGEISEPRLRGILSGFPFVAYSMGILLVYFLGASLPWRVAAGLGVVLPIISLLALALSPESPSWLARKGKFSKATTAIARLRGDESIAQRELHQLMSAIEKEKQDTETDASFFGTIKKIEVVKPLVIINIFNILQILSGTYIVVFYAADIISESAGGEVDEIFAANITAVVRLVFTFIASIMLFYFGRRTLALVSGVGSSISTVVLGIYMWTTLEQYKSDTSLWITAVCLFIYIASNTIGFFMLPGIMIGELLPAKVRGACGGYIYTLFNILLFAFAKAFPFLIKSAGIHIMFLVFGISSLIGTIFLYLFLPETKGQTLIQIEQYFKKPNFLYIHKQKPPVQNLLV